LQSRLCSPALCGLSLPGTNSELDEVRTLRDRRPQCHFAQINQDFVTLTGISSASRSNIKSMLLGYFAEVHQRLHAEKICRRR